MDFAYANQVIMNPLTIPVKNVTLPVKLVLWIKLTALFVMLRM